MPVRPLASGLSRLAIWVQGTSVEFGRVGGHAVLFLNVPLRGPGTVLEGHPPVDSASGPAERMASPLTLRAGKEPLLRPHPMTEFDLSRTGTRNDDVPHEPLSHASFNVTGRWTYWLEDLITTSPQRWATVEVWDEDAGVDDLLWTGLTDEEGNFTSAEIPRAEEVGQGNQDVYVRFVACNTAVCAQATNGTTYSWRTETVTLTAEDTFSFGTRASGTNQFAQRPFQYINNAWDYAVNFGGLGPILGQVRVLMPDACTFYTLSDDTIHLCAGGIDDRSPDDVGHEYAHYVQDKMYGDSFWPSPGGVHFLCGDGQHRGLSWTEGFANFFGPRANQAVVDPQDHFYTRPWDGSLFSFDLEGPIVCPSSVTGDDNELRVAFALWDLADDVDDGPWDIGVRHAPDVLFGAITGCDQSSYREFYDGGQCNWIDRGNPRFDFLATALQNTIDYNLEPETEVTSPSAFSWVGGSLVATANATDPDSSVTSVEFRVSRSAACASFELPGVIDASAPFSVMLDTTSLADGRNYWVCARGADELEDGAWAASSRSFGLDTTAPVSTASIDGMLGVEGWYVTPVTVELLASDITSGVASVSYRLDQEEVRAYTNPFEVQGDGIHTVAFFAVDAAGNVENIQPLLVLIDTGPPQIQILQPTPGAYIGQSEMTLTWSVTDTGAGVEACAVRLDGGPVIPVLSDRMFTFTGIADGAHQVFVSCEDRVDRVAEVEVSFTVDSNPLSPTGPFGPTLVLGLAGIVILFVALLLRRRK
ncbi:MAG: Ig-like domain-containing protein [Thermoplasmata archaeon]